MERFVWVIVLIFSICLTITGIVCCIFMWSRSVVGFAPALLFTAVGGFGLLGSYHDHQDMQRR